MLSNYTDEELAGFVAGGQGEYFAEIMARYERKIYAMVRKYFQGAHKREADDVIQEIWIKLFKSLKNYDSDRAALGTFIYRIAESECLDFKRSKWAQRLEETTFDADMPEQYENDESGAESRPSGEYQLDPVQYYAVKTAIKIMFSKIGELPATLRDILILRFVANVSEKEIAAERGCTVSAVRSNITRASQMLVDAMRDLSNPEEVAKILCKGSFVLTAKDVERIKAPRVQKFLEFISVRRAPMETIFKTLKCDTKADRQKLMDSAVEEILKFQRTRKIKKVSPEKLIAALFAAAGKIIDGENIKETLSSGAEILLAAKKKKINMDGLAQKLGVTDSALIKIVSDRLAVSDVPGLAAKIKKQLGIPLSRLRGHAGDNLLLSLRDRKSEDEFLDGVRRKVLRKLGIKQI
ncbi:MAG: sigma-70 family RNA polymerase sigma factor [Elusimicrobiota bacterium]|nr:sigma-70 family RNA polymerase sigma factor [Elusimicrobiota bacterium]